MVYFYFYLAKSLCLTHFYSQTNEISCNHSNPWGKEQDTLLTGKAAFGFPLCVMTHFRIVTVILHTIWFWWYPEQDYYVRCKLIWETVLFFVQTVASIEERTRPNLSKTLIGEKMFHVCLARMLYHIQILCIIVMTCFSDDCRTWVIWWTGTCCSWCDHPTDCALQTTPHLIE